MERLKIAVADKILEISSGNPEEMKFRLSKIQRFNDFAEACKTLMTKYPEIETELIEMVRDNDFDASRASRRVDSIISRDGKMPSDSTSTSPSNQIPEVIPIITPPPAAEPEPAIEEIPEEVINENQSLIEEELLVGETVAEEFPLTADESIETEKEVVFSTFPEEKSGDDYQQERRKKQPCSGRF
ncbi:MAG: hypothetical protein Q4G48_06905 [Bacteroidia bacterium]|nr:hypothetical protein [Bacteroidia bacterium]